MSSPANLLPAAAPSAVLPLFAVDYLDHTGALQSHTLPSKSLNNALKNFARAVPRFGRIQRVREVG